MRLCIRRSTDEEFVETVRRRIGGTEKSGLFHAGRLLLLALILVLLCELSPWLTYHGPMVESPMWQAISVADGTMIGLMFCFGVYSVIWMVRVYRGPREERLMIKFHDELNREERNIKDDNPGTPQ